MLKIPKLVSTAVLSLLILVSGIAAQPKPANANPTVVNNSGVSTAEADRRRSTELLPGQENALRQLSDVRSENSDSYANKIFAIKAKSNLALVRANKIVVPKEYIDKFNANDSKSKMNLAKILNNKCNDGNVVNVADIARCENALQIWGGGSFYSFRNETNFNTESGGWADIRLRDGKFISETPRNQVIMSRVGDVSIENLTLNSLAVKFLKDYQTKKKFSEIDLQKKLLSSGITENGFLYSTTAPVELNSIYVLRTIAYKTQSDEPGDIRADLILAFKVVGIEKDGSVIIIWKELKKDDAPRMKVY
jgi:hypothetical protein